jgi:hypothetical protein
MYNLKLKEMENADFSLLMQYSPKEEVAKKGRPEKVNPTKNSEKVKNWSEEIFKRMQQHPSLRYIGRSEEYKKEWKSKISVQKQLKADAEKEITEKLKVLQNETENGYIKLGSVRVKKLKNELRMILKQGMSGEGYTSWRLNYEDILNRLQIKS